MKILDALLDYRPGTAFYIVTTLVVAFVIVVGIQYMTEGRVDLTDLVNSSDPGTKAFLERNPVLEHVDHYTKTSFHMVRVRGSSDTAMVDLEFLTDAEFRPRACAIVARPRQVQYPGAAGEVCFDIAKPDTGGGHLYVAAMSFAATAKASEVAAFYRALFAKRGYKVNSMQESSRGIKLEAENAASDTVARISIRASFDTANAFLAWTKSFR